MQRNIILAGVGGQGILSIAYVIDNAALESDLRFKQAEVHGMAQRGGGVQSHLRISDKEIFSDLIPKGRADIILSVEPIEALRYTEYLSDDGVVVTSTSPYVNIPDYPPLETVYARLMERDRVVAIDADRLAREAGTSRASNMVTLGAGSPFLGISPEALERWVVQLFQRKSETIVEKNILAFRAGRAVSLLQTALRDAGMDAADTLALTMRLSGEGIDLDSVPTWVQAFSGPRASTLREALATLEKEALVKGDVETATRAVETGALV